MNASRNRKIVYLLSIVGLFSVLIWSSRVLNQRADEYKLSQKSLGQVNPVSGTAQLVMMGFRGVAVTFLWHEAIELKKKERWFEIRPVLESITLLQPNFVAPWTFQAWNMAFNIAGDWESVPDKYYWIRQGIDFMKNACKINKDKSDLEWETAWIYHSRFGVSDEHVYLREMFRNDPDDEFVLSSAGIKDSFLVAYDWFSRANDTIFRLGVRPKRKGSTPFMAYVAISKTDYANFMGKEGVFGEKNLNAWRAAHREWIDFGLKGEKNRNEGLCLRLEYTDDEFKQLTEDQRYWIDRYRKMISYNYWRRRTQLEAGPELQIAREAAYNATKARKEGDYLTALKEYERAFPPLRKVLDNDYVMREDVNTTEDCQRYEYHYLRILRHLDKPAPAKRPFDGLYPELIIDENKFSGSTYRDLERPNIPTQPR